MSKLKAREKSLLHVVLYVIYYLLQSLSILEV